MTGLLDAKRYALAYVGMLVGLLVLSVVLEKVFGYQLSSGITSVLPAMLAAMLEGQKRAESGEPRLTAQQAWAAARNMTYIVALITAVNALLLLLLPAMRVVILSLPGSIVLAVLAALLGITLLTNRFFVTFGYDSQRKAIEKRGRN